MSGYVFFQDHAPERRVGESRASSGCFAGPTRGSWGSQARRLGPVGCRRKFPNECRLLKNFNHIIGITYIYICMYTVYRVFTLWKSKMKPEHSRCRVGNDHFIFFFQCFMCGFLEVHASQMFGGTAAVKCEDMSIFQHFLRRFQGKLPYINVWVEASELRLSNPVKL